MPKQPTRGQAVRTATLQLPLDRLHCRQINAVFQDARDKARLRGTHDGSLVEVRALPHRDPLVRRLFSRSDIAAERMTLRAALASAACNVTPERLRSLGSPGRLAVDALQNASGIDVDRDIRAGQLRNAVALLAGNRRKRSFADSPAKPRSGWLAQTGANSLALGDGARRVQLRRFCIDSVATGRLPALMGAANDAPASIDACIAIFRVAAMNYIVEAMKGGGRSPDALAAQARKEADGPLLRLFIARWRRAIVAGKIRKADFLWFDAVDWLVGALHGARPTSPGATRSPRSPRVTSPAAAALRRAQTEAMAAKRPTLPEHPARQAPTAMSTSGRRAVVRRRATVVRAAPQPQALQPGRQGVKRRILTQLQSPTRLVHFPALPPAPKRTASDAGDSQGPAFKPPPAPAAAPRTGGTGQLAPTVTLLDILLQEYSAGMLSAVPGKDGADSDAEGQARSKSDDARKALAADGQPLTDSAASTQ